MRPSAAAEVVVRWQASAEPAVPRAQLAQVISGGGSDVQPGSKRTPETLWFEVSADPCGRLS